MNEITRSGTGKDSRLYNYQRALPQVESLEEKQFDSREGRDHIPEREELYRIYYMIQGWMTLQLSHEIYHLPSGHFCLVKPGDTLSRREFSQTGNHFYIIRFYSPDDFPAEYAYLGISPEERNRIFSIVDNKANPIIKTSLRTKGIFEEIDRLSHELSRDGEENPDRDLLMMLHLENLYREVLILLGEGASLQANALDCMIDSVLPRLPREGYSPIIINAIGRMSENLEEDLTLVSLADGVNISLSRFKERFKQETGLGPLDYFTRLSVQRAMGYLCSSEDPLAVIANDMGFSSSAYFASVFKKTVGLTPVGFREWRKRNSP